MDIKLDHVKDKESYNILSFADHWLFLICFVFGSIGLIFIKALSPNQYLATAFPLVIMGGYSAYVLRVRLQDQQAGDGVYYLGFLFTLVSVAITLYQFNTGENATLVIISNFGIALATTIAGLALRVVFAQLRESPEDITERAREDMTAVAKRLTQVMLDVSDQFRELQDRLSKDIDHTGTAIRESLGGFKDELGDEVKDLRGLLTKLGDSIGQGADSFNKATQRSADAVELLAAQTGDLGDALHSSTEYVAKFNEQLSGIAKLQGVLNEIFHRAEQLAVATERSSSGLTELLRGTGNIHEEIGKQMEFIQRHRKTIESDAARAQEAYQLLADSMIGLSETIVTKLDGSRQKRK